MAALNRPTQATYTVHEELTVDTEDNEDHTFCGIMFPVKCKDLLPLEHLVIKSVSVRGKLGPLTVWVSDEDQVQPNGEHRVRLNKAFWTKLYDQTHGSSRRNYKKLVLSQPIVLKPGETRVIYIHSTLPGDEAIVYDNSHHYGATSKRYEDDNLTILTGRAHVSTTVFGQEPIWGWGNAWRDRREFCGQLEYGIVYRLWNPTVQPKFGSYFQDGARSLLLCQRRWESPFSRLPDECIYYILNMCRWDWFQDDSGTMRERRTREKSRIRAAEARRREPAPRTEAAAAGTEDDRKPASSSSCQCTNTETNDDEEEEDHDEDYEMEQDDDDDDSEEVADSEDDDAWSEDDDEEDHYHRANVQSFAYQDVDSDDEPDATELARAEAARRDWMRHQFARVHVLRALATMEDGQGGNLFY